MGRGSKFTLEQRRFLSTFSPEFLETRAAGDKRPTLLKCFTGFFEQWPVKVPESWKPGPYVAPKVKDAAGKEIVEKVTSEELERRVKLDAEKVTPTGC